MMKQAGLTLGCSYEHFESHETSVADAVGFAPEPWNSANAASATVLSLAAPR